MAGYGDDSGFAEWLAANGYSLPDSAPSPAVLRQRGSVEIDALYGSRFVGQPTDGVAQERAWPRTGAVVFGSAVASDVVPSAVVTASYHAAYFATQNAGPSETIGDAGRIKRDRVGDAETEFFGPGAGGSDHGLVTVYDGILAPYLNGPGFGIWSIG